MDRADRARFAHVRTASSLTVVSTGAFILSSSADISLVPKFKAPHGPLPSNVGAGEVRRERWGWKGGGGKGGEGKMQYPGHFSIFVCKSFAQKPGSLKNLGLGFWFLRHVGRGRYGHLRDML